MDNNYTRNINNTIPSNVQNAPYGYQANTQIPIPQKTRGSAAKVVALALCCSLVGGVCGAGGFAAYEFLKSGGIANIINTERNEDADDEDDATTVKVGEREDSRIKKVSVDTTKTMTAAEIYAANVNSTVGIQTSVNTNFFGYQTQSAAAGSGFILTSDGYIVTNYHVVEGAESIQVTSYDNKTYDAKLIGYDENNDVAVLKIDATGLTPVVLGDSDNMNVGDDVVAIGNPLGELTFSLTKGAVSALNRNITIENMAMTLIQTDCAINSGNSGGALFNSHGEVIGITNAKYSSSGKSTASVDNIGFAIPMNSVKDIITSIIEKGYIEKVYMGVTVYSEDSTRRGSKGSSAQGLTVKSVEKDSPAETAGVQEGDIITEVNGEKVTAYSDLSSVISKSKAGDVITLTINRDGETLKIKVTLGVHQQAALPEKDSSSNDQAYPGDQESGNGNGRSRRGSGNGNAP
uniref:Serine protease n=1 Tax=uncultured bacterium Contig1758 TaxID=1393501 RepID=W0FP86_9BACT|nr:serine protease [uncultured bacterium Contig1758]